MCTIRWACLLRCISLKLVHTVTEDTKTASLHKTSYNAICKSGLLPVTWPGFKGPYKALCTALNGWCTSLTRPHKNDLYSHWAQLSLWFVSRLFNEFKKTFPSSSSWQDVKTEKHISWFSFLPQLGWMTLLEIPECISWVHACIHSFTYAYWVPDVLSALKVKDK